MGILHEIQPSYRAVYYIPLSQIRLRPSPARDQDDDQNLFLLAASIRQYGLLQPITVRTSENGYEIVMGQRRFQACVMLGFSYIDAFVLQCTEQEGALYSLLENVRQEPLHFFDLAAACAALRAGGIPSEAIARQLGESADWVEKKLQLLHLAPETRKYIRSANLTERHARALLPLASAEEQLNYAKRAERLHLSPHETEALIKKKLSDKCQQKRKIISVVWEPRLYLNAIHRIIREMQEAGTEAQTDTREDNQWITMQIKIRKRK